MPEGRIARLWAELGLRSTLSSEISREVGAARAATVAGTRSIAQGLGGLRQVGQNLTKFVTLPLIGAGGAAVKSAVDFESAFAGVRKTVDATEGQLAELRTGILAMSRELPATKEQIAGVAEAAGQLGVRTGAILGFTRTMIDLGESTNLAAQDAATALARLANITQMPQGQFDRLGSTVVELGNKLASTESEIVEMGLRIAGAGKQIGLSEAQILSFAGALSSVGINAEAGGTSISRVMLTMQKDVLDGGRQLRRFAAVAGMSAGDFSRAFRRDAAGAIIAFIEGLERLRAGGVPVASVLKDLKLGEIRVRDALMRAAGAGDLFTRSMKIGTGVWRENNALTKEAAQRYKTTESRLKILRNRIMAAAIPLGEVLIPAIEQTVGVVAALAEGFAGLPGPVRTAIVALMGVAAASGPILRVAASLARLRAALGLVSLTPIGAALTAFRGAAVAGAGATGALTAGLGALGAAMIPLAAVTAGVVAPLTILALEAREAARATDRLRGKFLQTQVAAFLAGRSIAGFSDAVELAQGTARGGMFAERVAAASRGMTEEVIRAQRSFQGLAEHLGVTKEQLQAVAAEILGTAAQTAISEGRFARWGTTAARAMRETGLSAKDVADQIRAAASTSAQFRALLLALPKDLRVQVRMELDAKFAIAELKASLRSMRAIVEHETGMIRGVILGNIAATERKIRQRQRALRLAQVQAPEPPELDLGGFGDELDESERDVEVWAGLTESEFRDWSRGVMDSVNSVRGVLDALSSETVVTAGRIAREFGRQATALDDLNKNVLRVLRRGLPRALVKELLAMGTEGAKILQGLADASDEEFDRILRRWRRLRRERKETKDILDRLESGELPKPPKKRKGKPRRRAQHGGRSGPFEPLVIGEDGPEIARVAPGGRMQVFPHRVLRRLEAAPATGAGGGARAMTAQGPSAADLERALGGVLARTRLRVEITGGATLDRMLGQATFIRGRR